MSISIPAGPDPATIVTFILEAYPETDLVEAMNAYFFSLDPEKHWPNYATLVTTDEHDDTSDLDRPGVFRLNLGVDRETFDRIAGGVVMVDGPLLIAAHVSAALALIVATGTIQVFRPAGASVAETAVVDWLRAEAILPEKSAVEGSATS